MVDEDITEKPKPRHFYDIISEFEGTDPERAKQDGFASPYDVFVHYGKPPGYEENPWLIPYEFMGKNLSERPTREVNELQFAYSQRRDRTQEGKMANWRETTEKIKKANSKIIEANAGRPKSEWKHLLEPLPEMPKPLQKKSNAAGAYQITGETLKWLLDVGAVDGDAPFNEETQKKAMMYLLNDKGFQEYLKGDKSEDDLMYGISKVWASSPTPLGYKTQEGRIAEVSYDKRGRKRRSAYYDGEQQAYTYRDDTELREWLRMEKIKYQREHGIADKFPIEKMPILTTSIKTEQNLATPPSKIATTDKRLRIPSSEELKGSPKTFDDVPSRNFDEVPSKKFGLGGFLKNLGVGIVDNAMSVVGATDVADNWYTDDKMGKKFKKVTDFTGELNKVGGQIAATAIGGPMAGTALGAVQQQVGQATVKDPIEEANFIPQDILDPRQSGNPNFAYGGHRNTQKRKSLGGLRSILDPKIMKGRSHATGGINVGAGQEVEGGEVIWKDFVFSNRF